MRTSPWRVRVGRGDGGEPTWLVAGERGQCIAEAATEELAEVLATLPDLVRELEHRTAQLAHVFELAISLGARPRSRIRRIVLVLEDWAARGFQSPGLDRVRGAGRCEDDRSAEGPGGPQLRRYPPWLPLSGVSSSAVLLWAELDALQRLGACRELRIQDLAERIPWNRGRSRSVRTVKRLLLELVAVGALTITPCAGRPSTFEVHATPKITVVQAESVPAVAAAVMPAPGRFRRAAR